MPATLSRLTRIFAQRLRSIFSKERMDGELRNEFAFHFERLVEENIERGMTVLEARAAARRSFGSTGVFEEECRDQRRVGWLHDLWQDMRYGVRLLRKNPAFTVLTVASLALGIGANTAILGVMDRVLFGALAVPGAERLAVIRTYPFEHPQQNNDASVPDFVAWQEHSRSFESVGASLNDQRDLGMEEDGAPPERITGQRFTAGLFETLGVEPMLGRVFTHEEAREHSAPVIVLSHRIWQRRFGGDPNIVQRQVRLSGESFSVIGVMPPDFHYPLENSDYWLPLSFNRGQLQGSARYFKVTGRLKAGTTIRQAQLEMDALAARLAEDFPDWHRGWGVRVQSLRDFRFGWTMQPLMMLEGAVLLVMLIACANVAALLLARGSARRPEFAMRAALGAGRGRLVRQLLAESAVLSMLGGAAGLWVATFGLKALATLSPPPGAARIGEIALNFPMLGLTALCATVAGLAFGIVPVLAGFGPASMVRKATGRASRPRLRGTLVAGQIGLALVLLVGSGLLIRSFIRLVGTERNFDPKDVLSFDFRIPLQQYLKAVGSYRGLPAMAVSPPSAALQRVYERLRLLPDAESVAGISFPPVDSLVVPAMRINLEGEKDSHGADRRDVSAAYFLVTPDFFRTMKTPLIRGRDFDVHDSASALWVAVVNETAARRFWPDEDPIGKQLTLDAVSGEKPREVVGVVRDVPLRYVRTESEPVVYVSYLQQPELYYGPLANMFGQMTFLVRTGGDPLKLVSAARKAVAEVDPERPIADIQMLNPADRFGGSVVRDRRRYAIVLGVFALTATLLAAIGVYGVMAYSVAQRTGEIGIRIALGATGRQVVSLIGRQALLLIGSGLAAGLACSMTMTRLISSQLWGVAPTDPLTFAAVTMLLTLVAVAACLIPLRRAIRVDPAESLRSE